MLTALTLLAVQGVIGAFDTLYYHEWRARLPARAPHTAPELRLHAFRDFIYAGMFGSLPWLAWQGWSAAALIVLLVTEVGLTLADFVVEIQVRKPLGDVFAGERLTHAIMGVTYGAMLAHLLPVVLRWWSLPTRLAPTMEAVPPDLRWTLTILGIGVALSGARDLYAALGLPCGGWPWVEAEAGFGEQP
jgi:hypothetical protein